MGIFTSRLREVAAQVRVRPREGHHPSHRFSPRLWLLQCMLVSLLLPGTGCTGAADPASRTLVFSFERNMEGWLADGADLNDPPVEWSIERSEDIASDGDVAVRLYLNNVNDAGKIWIERGFAVPDSPTCRVRIEYDLASADWGDVNLWTIITGVSASSPESAADLRYPENTGNGAASNRGFVWSHRSYDFELAPAEDGRMYAFIGVWGTWETARTYYLDNVSVSFEPLAA